MASWIPDGSVGFTINGDIVTYVDNAGVGNVFNASWQEGDSVSSGQHYWKIHFPTLEQGAGVGITSKDSFKKGYGCRGLDYSGNLSNGSGLLVGNFGPCPKQGDTIGILAAFDDDRLKMYIDVNGGSLGLAFDVPSSTFKSIFPIVSFDGSGSATCTKQTEIPTNTNRTPFIFTGIEGNWKATNLTENDAELGLTRIPTAKITKTDTDKYSWHIHVVNNLRARLAKADETWKVVGISSTKMGGDPKSMEEESAVKRLMKEVKTIEVDGSGNLIVKSDKISSIWIRYDATPRPFVGDPFE